MGKRWWTNDWLLQLAVAVGYGLLYLAIHPLSTAYWPVHVGVRLACLLLMPYRFWPALYVGEILPNIYEILPCTEQGTIWMVLRSIPPFTITMPIVWWCRERMPPLPRSTQRLVDIKALLVCVLLVSLGNMVYSSAASATSLAIPGPMAVLPWTIAFFLGPYLAILSIIPWALLAWLNYERGHLREQAKKALISPLVLETVVLLFPAVVLLAWLDKVGSDQIKQIATIAMFLPMAWLTLKHGWRAVALSAPLVIACISLPLPIADTTISENVYATQFFLSIAVTSLFVLGARISVQLVEEEQERVTARNVQRIARQNLQMGEQRMRQASQALEYLAGTLHLTNGRLLEQMRRIVPNIESHAFYKQALATQTQVYRLAESMHPIAWRERGLPAALNETIARALDEAGIAYRCQISGRGFTRLAPSVLTATYRAACEVVVYVTSRLSCTGVNLTLRGGETRGKRWVALRVEGVLEETGIASAVYHSEERKRLATKLGASILDVPEIRDHVRIFDGELHTRMPKDRLSITVLLHDAMQEERSVTSAPMRLWVN
ncbi:MASE1 domain-containing protein [Dyella monticola]|nr:MASE1 domain-containing protein [Dyella monticola]